jgi:signal transduction histidine kinase
MKSKQESVIRKLVFSFLIILTLSFFLTAMNMIALLDKLDDQNTYLFSIFTLLMLNIIGFSFAFIISSSIAKPLHKLKAATMQIENGNYNTKVNIHSKDEFKDLGDAFNNMSKKINQTIEEFRKIEKMKTHFLGITAHELRTPIAAIKMQVELMKKTPKSKLTKDARKGLEIQTRNLKRLEKLINDILDLTKIESARINFEWQKADLNQEIKNSVEHLRAEAKKKSIKLDLRLEKILKEVEIDKQRFSQVFENILGNAVKFTPEKGRITISTTARKDDVLVQIEDTGIGIKKEFLKKIFEPFYQIEGTLYREYGGTGLGLAICKGLIEVQGGKIWAESKDKGSSFCFTVPYAPKKEAKPMKLFLDVV